ncbi:hypothetical protein [Cytobacillus purgationiresistens]|uniref:Uncharacterized protein n=1 Tax=Cytobacillus purgationiresistens TaxID=863449 RepID=A0ABU0AMD8_9BACI|nr:hypothetical protein [Cytobacillus purgationiresistens]MDQ0272424.1 hypothetical protein [Cytobacillus purgationiresistens]
MKSLQDALYNWLTIKIVSDARKEDQSALETEEMFHSILMDEHGLTDLQIEKDDEMYYLHYNYQNASRSTRFPRELIEVMLKQMQAEPEKYINYPVDE